MSASSQDKITDVRNAARPNSARVTLARSAGGTTLTCNSLTGWPTASKVHFVTYQIDTNSDPVAGTQLDCSGIVSSNTITSLTVIDGSDTGNSIGDVVEMLPTAAWGQDLADALGQVHERTGLLKSGISIPSPTIVTPTIASFINATHTHADSGGGGQLNATNALTAATLAASVMKYGMVRNRQGGLTGDATWATTGTSTVNTSAKDVFIQVGAITTSSSADVTVTFPTAFSQVPLVFAQSQTNIGIAQTSSITASNFVMNNYTTGNARQALATSWIAIGQ